MKKNMLLALLLFGSVFVLGGKNVSSEVKNNLVCDVNYEAGMALAENDNSCFRYKEKVNAKEPKNLMIVAHPDDEVIFGGAHLINEKYTVVCITCGKVDYRVDEFTEVMGKTNDDYIMLGYDDRVNITGPISDWSYQYDQIYASLKEIIESEDWDKIVTHNPDGEYGHLHHKLTSEIVTNITGKNKLIYFGHWYKNGDTYNRISDELYNIKVNELLSVYYRSQGVALNYNSGMFAYENWIEAVNW